MLASPVAASNSPIGPAGGMRIMCRRCILRLVSFKTTGFIEVLKRFKEHEDMLNQLYQCSFNHTFGYLAVTQ